MRIGYSEMQKVVRSCRNIIVLCSREALYKFMKNVHPTVVIPIPTKHHKAYSSYISPFSIQEKCSIVCIWYFFKIQTTFDWALGLAGWVKVDFI